MLNYWVTWSSASVFALCPASNALGPAKSHCSCTPNQSRPKTRLVLLGASSGVNFCTNGPNSPSCSPSSLGLKGFLEICNLWGAPDPQLQAADAAASVESSFFTLTAPFADPGMAGQNLLGKQRKWCHPRYLLDIYNQTFQWWNVMNVLRSGGERSNWHSKGSLCVLAMSWSACRIQEKIQKRWEKPVSHDLTWSYMMQQMMPIVIRLLVEIHYTS